MYLNRGFEVFCLHRCLNFSDKPDQGMDFPGFLQLMQWWKPRRVTAQVYLSERCQGWSVRTLATSSPLQRRR